MLLKMFPLLLLFLLKDMYLVKDTLIFSEAPYFVIFLFVEKKLYILHNVKFLQMNIKYIFHRYKACNRFFK